MSQYPFCIILAGMTTWLCLQNMGYNYLQRRSELVTTVLRHSQSFGLREEVAHDAILLMDRIMSTSIQVTFQYGRAFLMRCHPPRSSTIT